MDCLLRINRHVFSRIVEHHTAAREKISFGFATTCPTRTGLLTLAPHTFGHITVADPGAYAYQHFGGLSLRPQEARALLQAFENSGQNTLVGIHNHPPGCRFFSATDDADELRLIRALARRPDGKKVFLLEIVLVPPTVFLGRIRSSRRPSAPQPVRLQTMGFPCAFAKRS